MTEAQIQARIDRHRGHLDRLMLSGTVDVKTYRLAIDDLYQWAAYKRKENTDG